MYHYNLGEGISFDKLDKHTLLGEVSFTLADLVRTPTQKLELELGGTKYGKSVFIFTFIFIQMSDLLIVATTKNNVDHRCCCAWLIVEYTCKIGVE